MAGYGGLVAVEYRTRRVTRSGTRPTDSGLRLLGTVPALGGRAGRGGRYNADPHRALAEAIDTTRTLVLYGAADRRVRTLLVTSAVDGEGKTSLAGHLAISLARAGFRTLLVDGDVQAPSAHALFGVPAAPGLCEVLRGEAPRADALHPTGLPGLTVLPAGAWDLVARQALAGNRWKAIRAELEAEYDFVIVDSGPVLLVSDSLLMARDADGVLLSVLLDVSRVASVEETRDRLRAVGANVLGVVVNGVVTPSYRSAQVRGPVVAPRPAGRDRVARLSRSDLAWGAAGSRPTSSRIVHNPTRNSPALTGSGGRWACEEGTPFSCWLRPARPAGSSRPGLPAGSDGSVAGFWATTGSSGPRLVICFRRSWSSSPPRPSLSPGCSSV